MAVTRGWILLLRPWQAGILMPGSRPLAASLTESVIREMTRLAQENDAINLAQGFPDFPAPEPVKRAAIAAIETDLNQYPITWGQPSIRQALADAYLRWYGITSTRSVRFV